MRAALSFLCGFVACYAALNPIVVKGNMFYDSVTKERFYVKGVTYGYDISDTYAANWKKALELVSQISNVNTIRVYNILPSIDSPPLQYENSFDEFMSQLESYGIYAMISVTPPGLPPWEGCTLNRDGDPDLFSPQTCYPSCLLTYGQAVINQFSKYPNTLAYVVGNEVMNSASTWGAAPCVKAFASDLKNYMRSCITNFRFIPLIYAAADDGQPGVDANVLDAQKAEYLLCGDPKTNIDAFGINVYRWCNSECTYESCQYASLVNAMAGLPAPLVLTEMGCDQFYWDPSTTPTLGQRDWKQIGALFSPQMSATWSGGLAYAYGVTGGDGFALFVGGGRSADDSPGFTKACGYPNDMCNVDNLSNQFATVIPEAMTAVGADICDWLPANFSYSTPQCPVAEYIPTTIAASRQGAAGYVAVTCPATTLTALEVAINSCHGGPTPAPTLAPRTTPAPGSPRTPSPEVASSSLSPGAIVGIVLGSVAGVTLMAVGGKLVYARVFTAPTDAHLPLTADA